MMRYERTSRAGTTLLELLVVLVVLGIIMAIAGPSVNAVAHDAPPTPQERIAAARREAIQSGHSTQLVLRDSSGVHVVRVSPDGSALGASSFSIDAASGRPANVTR